MPLHKIELTNFQSGWAIWHITETEAELSGKETCPADITNVIKRLEWLAGRILMRELVEKAGLTYHGIHKNDFGKPFLNGLSHPISLSHSYPYVAAQVEQSTAVGIDIEQPKSKLLKIAPRIFSPGEADDAGTGLIKNCIYWCAKESLYKIYGQRGLSFIEHLRIQPFEAGRSGDLTGWISANSLHLNYSLFYEVNTDFVLVRTKRSS